MVPLAYLVSCINGTRQTFSPGNAACPLHAQKLIHLKLWTSSLRNIQDAWSWTVCCSTDFDIRGLSKY